MSIFSIEARIETNRKRLSIHGRNKKKGNIYQNT